MEDGFWQALAELRADLAGAIEEEFAGGKLNDFDRLVIALHYLCGFTFAEIADGFDVHEDVVRRSHRKALEALRASPRLKGWGAVGSE